MQLLDGDLVLTATDLTGHLACPHLTELKAAIARGELFVARSEDPHAELLRRRGHEHERAYLAQLGKTVEIPFPAESTRAALEAAERATLDAMRDGAPYVYQATFFDGRWRGHADFLRRVERPSRLGDWSYEVVDTKLARALKASFVHQLCSYSEHVTRLQGVEPHEAHVVLGTGEEVSVRLRDVMAVHRHAVARLEEAVAVEDITTYPEPVEHCAVCEFWKHCTARRIQDDHLSLVANIRRDQRKKLEALDLTTLEQLASADPELRTGDLAPAAYEQLRSQAELQLRTHRTKTLHRRHLEPERARGYARLPAPSPADVFFDLEGDPYLGVRGVEYLWGWVAQEEGGGWRYEVVWAHEEGAECEAFEGFVDMVVERHHAQPAMHVYHYGHHEATTLKRLAAQYATREAEVDELLREGVLVDLFAVVRQGLQVGQPGYSIKQLEPFYMEPRDEAIKTAGGSIVAYEAWLETGDNAILEDIRAYNEDDCRSTSLLRDWLLGLREEAAAHFAVDFAALAERESERREEPPWVAELEDLIERLSEGLAENPEDDDTDAAERRLLTWLLLYHRREGRPEWWRFFDLRSQTAVDLIAEADAIGGLEPDRDRPPDPIKRSLGHWMTFPAQEQRLGPGGVVDPATGESGGKIVELDPAGRLLLKRGPKLADVPLPQALIGPGPLQTTKQREALVRVAQSVLADSDRDAAVRSILRRSHPRLRGLPVGAPLQDGAITVADTTARGLALERSHLPLQGPPGSGKTYRAAQLIVASLREGRRVGVSAVSHKAIHNLLREVEELAAREGVEVRGFHKCSGAGSEYESIHGFVDSGDKNADAADPALNLVSGTPWLLSREEHDGQFDLLVIDEAGQMALADAVAIGTCATSIVMFGDPQQLPQVTQASHPGSSGCSVVEHLLNGAVTIAPERGLFLTETRRMHPDICAWVSEALYDGRLQAIPECRNRRVDAPGALNGAGLRWLTVEHEGRSQASPEEAQAIAECCRELLAGGTVTGLDGQSRELRAQDIMVVAPYNLAVRCIERAVPEGVRVGTVDRFQGQEAAVVFYAMTTSAGEDAPRGLEFLFSRNRLNVAISRGQCLSVLVASPSLLDAHCRTVEQMRLVNNVCRLTEMGPSRSGGHRRLDSSLTDRSKPLRLDQSLRSGGPAPRRRLRSLAQRPADRGLVGAHAELRVDALGALADRVGQAASPGAQPRRSAQPASARHRRLKARSAVAVQQHDGGAQPPHRVSAAAPASGTAAQRDAARRPRAAGSAALRDAVRVCMPATGPVALRKDEPMSAQSWSRPPHRGHR